MKKLIFAVILIFFFGNVNSFIMSEEIDLQALSQKEKKRREKGQKAKYVLTDDNLKTIKLPKKTYSVVIMLAPQEQEDGEKKQSVKDKKKDLKKSKEYWQIRSKSIADSISQFEAKIKTGELALNQIFFNYSNMDLPLQKERLKLELENMTKKLNGDKLELLNLKKQLESLADEARKAGVPPGWVR